MNTIAPRQFTKAQMLFGNEVETVRLSDECFPSSLKAMISKLDITGFGGILAVPCGTIQNLCAIVLPTQNQTMINNFQLFLTENPSLKTTVITRWRNLSVIWLRLAGWRPASRFLLNALWIREGMVPAADVADSREGLDGFPYSGNSIITVQFENLIWPEEVHESFLLERIECECGRLFEIGERNRTIFSVHTAARFFAKLLCLRYSKLSDAFTVKSRGGQVGLFNSLTLASTINRWLGCQVRMANVKFPSGDPVASVIKTLKNICDDKETDKTDSQPGKI